jgi:hypothetical protein
MRTFLRGTPKRVARNSHLDALAVAPREFGARRSGLDVKLENQSVAAPMRRWFTMISST